jgi:ectoine hydroxylase-related dioxygenase (phytanoyl-CoA dioxygenase family)
MLSPQQILDFQTNGFVKGARILSDDEIAELQSETLRVIDNRDQLEHRPVQLSNLTGNPDNPLWQIVNIHRASQPFERLIRHAALAAEVAQLIEGHEVRLWHDQIAFKPAQTGGVNPWHQDSPLWPPIANKEAQITAWIALDDVEEDNGCMRMVPGSHRWGNHIRWLEKVPSFDEMPAEFEGHALEVVSCPVRKGEVHYHHALTWHGSGLNTSGRPRRAIALHFMNENSTFDPNGGLHPMSQFIKVPAGAKIEGEAFPLVWPM